MKNVWMRYQKKWTAGIALIALMILWITGTAVSVPAAENGGAKVYVTDDAGILSEEEEQKLQKLCEKASKNCETDIVIMTTRTGKDYSVLDQYVRDIIHSDYGYQENSNPPDAVVYVIDMVSRADRVVTSGNAQRDITQEQLDDIRIKAEKKLADGKYYEGCKSYISGIQRRMNHSLMYRLTLFMPVKLGIAAAAALIAVLVMMHSAKAKMTANSRTYQDKGYKVIARTDQLVNTTVTTRVIPSSSGSSGGGGGGGGNSGSSGGHF